MKLRVGLYRPTLLKLKVDLVSPEVADAMDALLSACNSTAEVIRTTFANVPIDRVLGTGAFDLATAEASEAWRDELEQVHTPETEEYGISSFVYAARKPFHGERLYRFLEENQPGVIRAKGFFWIASRPELALGLSQAGALKRVEHAGYWWAAIDRAQWDDDPATATEIERDWHEEFGDRRQELVFIGQSMDELQIRKALDQALVADDELDGIRGGTLDYDDPFEQFIDVELEEASPE